MFLTGPTLVGPGSCAPAAVSTSPSINVYIIVQFDISVHVSNRSEAGRCCSLHTKSIPFFGNLIYIVCLLCSMLMRITTKKHVILFRFYFMRDFIYFACFILSGVDTAFSAVTGRIFYQTALCR